MSYLKKVENWQEMADWFQERTTLHIHLFQKYLRLIEKLNLPEIDNDILMLELDHDNGKWNSPEYEPYVHLTWKYRQQRLGSSYLLSPEIKEQVDEATWHHITNHKHHPEFWDSKAKPDTLSTRDRDEPSGKMIDATQMPLPYVASMMADWLAMSEEKNTQVKDWIKKNVNIRWKFTPEQVALINKIADLLGNA